MIVSRDEGGSLKKVAIPLQYAYIFVAAALVGLFTITGLAGSYSRMLIKTARFNQLRHDNYALQKDYAHLEEQSRQKDVRVASLGSLASEVSALYGLTTSKLAVPINKLTGKRHADAVEKTAATAPLADTASATDDSYYKSIDTFYALRNTALSGSLNRSLSGLGGPGAMTPLRGFPESGDVNAANYTPALWPVMGPITSSFGQRVDPVLGTGEGEFHTGIDISAPNGVPIRAAADGVVKVAELTNGYGREVIIDHGHGVETLYGHMSGFAVTEGQMVTRGEVIGYVGHSGRTTGSHLHYEVRIGNTPVNPYKYLRTTVTQRGDDTAAAPSTN